MVGVKQILLLKICKVKGQVDIADVLEVFEMHTSYSYSSRQIQRRLAEMKLKTLETYGYLRIAQDGYKLTKKGERKIDEWEKSED